MGRVGAWSQGTPSVGNGAIWGMSEQLNSTYFYVSRGDGQAVFTGLQCPWAAPARSTGSEAPSEAPVRWRPCSRDVQECTRDVQECTMRRVGGENGTAAHAYVRCAVLLHGSRSLGEFMMWSERAPRKRVDAMDSTKKLAGPVVQPPMSLLLRTSVTLISRYPTPTIEGMCFLFLALADQRRMHWKQWHDRNSGPFPSGLSCYPAAAIVVLATFWLNHSWAHSPHCLKCA